MLLGTATARLYIRTNTHALPAGLACLRICAYTVSVQFSMKFCRLVQRERRSFHKEKLNSVEIQCIGFTAKVILNRRDTKFYFFYPYLFLSRSSEDKQLVTAKKANKSKEERQTKLPLTCF